MTKSTLLFALAIAVVGCGEARKKDRDLTRKADWMVGTWQHKSAEGNLTEHWEKLNDSTYHGHAYFIYGKDTLHNERVVLSKRKGAITYSPTVQGQNEDKPVDFAFVSFENGKLTFENPAHNYPQKIVYQKKADSLVAEISGIQQGKMSSERFAMSKMK
ncbi:MAG: hypothetical protein IR153_00225 [Flavobacterium sp.]|nr:hypothetical protein [Flavobacterium sp.]